MLNNERTTRNRIKSMANAENLKSLAVRDIDERIKIAQQGGKKSGEVRKAKSELKKRLEILLATKGENGMTAEDEICLKLIQNAKAGNVKAFEVIRDTTGQHPRFDPAYSSKLSLNSLSKTQLAELRDMLLKEDEEFCKRTREAIEDYEYIKQWKESLTPAELKELEDADLDDEKPNDDSQD